MKSVLEPKDLITSKIEIENGFKWQIKKKAELSLEFISKKDYFEKKIKEAKGIDCLLLDKMCYEFLIAACSLSQKSLSNFDKNFPLNIIRQVIEFDKLRDPLYLNELNAKYFLTCGDSLGGMMRNIVGQVAQEKLTQKILDLFEKKNIQYSVKTNPKKSINEISWDNYIIVFNKKPKFINKSIDFILIKRDPKQRLDIEDFKNYLACGELKGGIDPAGADEHWKTANSALERIRASFKIRDWNIPALFFIGSAIEAAMANEIFQQMTDNRITAAANLNVEKQLEELIEILISQ